MTAAQAAAPSFRKTRQGEWVVFGAADQVSPGTIAVTKRDGSSKVVEIERVGRSFDVDGVSCVYGHVVESAPRRCDYAHPSERPGKGRGECTECGAYGPAGTDCKECYEGSHSC